MDRQCTCGGHAATRSERPRAPATTGSIVVTAGERIAHVALARCAIVLSAGRSLVCLADVWTASFLAGDLVDLDFDFIATDGHRLAAAGPGVRGETLARGFIDCTSHDLFWDAQLSVPCAFRVKCVAQMVARQKV